LFRRLLTQIRGCQIISDQNTEISMLSNSPFFNSQYNRQSQSTQTWFDLHQKLTQWALVLAQRRSRSVIQFLIDESGHVHRPTNRLTFCGLYGTKSTEKPHHCNSHLRRSDLAKTYRVTSWTQIQADLFIHPFIRWCDGFTTIVIGQAQNSGRGRSAKWGHCTAMTICK